VSILVTHKVNIGLTFKKYSYIVFQYEMYVQLRMKWKKGGITYQFGLKFLQLQVYVQRVET